MATKSFHRCWGSAAAGAENKRGVWRPRSRRWVWQSSLLSPTYMGGRPRTITRNPTSTIERGRDCRPVSATILPDPVPVLCLYMNRPTDARRLPSGAASLATRYRVGPWGATEAALQLLMVVEGSRSLRPPARIPSASPSVRQNLSRLRQL